MNRGCVAVGEIICDNCQRLIEAGQRYLVVEEEKGDKLQFCVECSVAKGYAAYVKEKGEEVLTFFPLIVEWTPPVPPLAEDKKEDKKQETNKKSK